LDYRSSSLYIPFLFAVIFVLRARYHPSVNRSFFPQAESVVVKKASPRISMCVVLSLSRRHFGVPMRQTFLLGAKMLRTLYLEESFP